MPNNTINIFLDGIHFAGSLDYVLVTSYSDFREIISRFDHIGEVSLGYRLRDAHTTFKAVDLMAELVSKGKLSVDNITIHTQNRLIRKKLIEKLKEVKLHVE